MHPNRFANADESGFLGDLGSLGVGQDALLLVHGLGHLVNQFLVEVVGADQQSGDGDAVGIFSQTVGVGGQLQVGIGGVSGGQGGPKRTLLQWVVKFTQPHYLNSSFLTTHFLFLFLVTAIFLAASFKKPNATKRFNVTEIGIHASYILL